MASDRSTFLDGYKANFETLQRASGNNDLCLMECTDAKTGEKVAAICAAHFEKATQQIVFTPLARMLEGNPYESLVPPGALQGK